MRVDGKALAEKMIETLVETAKSQSKKRVAFVLFGDNAASAAFVKRKMAVAERIGMEAVIVRKEVTDTAQALLALGEVIAEEYAGIVVQLPLPPELDTDLIIDSIPREMDIDMLSEDAKVHYVKADTIRVPPVAGAVQEILWDNKVIVIGKKIVIVGKGRLVGEPVSLLFDRQELRYTMVDIETPVDVRLAALKEADVIISGVGAPHSILPDMVKDGVILIDAGTSEQAGKLVGDFHPDCESKASVFTPVPGGVGPLTISCLFSNLFLE